MTTLIREKASEKEFTAQSYHIQTLDCAGKPTEMDIEIYYEDGSFYVRGIGKTGNEVEFLNTHGTEYEKVVVSTISTPEHGAKAFLQGDKGYIQFHQVGDTEIFNGYEIPYGIEE